ncbi:TetR/AcrR family transcriptional regulator [Acidobacteria bacterium AB60]|nr:TetR/AcrR family transcriptional regulator [Acidobacteria bacterium AB60]
MQHKKHRILPVLSANPNPLIDSPDARKPLLHNAARTSDPHLRACSPLARAPPQQHRQRHPHARSQHQTQIHHRQSAPNCVSYTQFAAPPSTSVDNPAHYPQIMKSSRTGKGPDPSARRSGKPARARGPRPGYSPLEVGKAAIRIADKEGLEAVTMQRVARELGLTTMAVYRYFPGKAELMAVMIDSAGESSPAFHDSALSWNDRMRAWARSCAAIYRNHPWFLEATSIRRTPLGPNELSWMESALAILTEAGLPPAKAYNAFFAIIGHVRAHAMFHAMARLAVSPREGTQDLAHTLQSHPATYPTLYAALQAGAFQAGAAEAFEFGLTCILDGIAVQVRTASSANTPTLREPKTRRGPGK